MKFWNKSADSADIFIYGDIVADRWSEVDTSAKSFIDDLKSFDGADVTIHINSGGGDCFSALAINNCLRNYAGNVTVSIEGLCASAATIIAMGANRITIADNSLMMIHNPSCGLCGYFDEGDISKVMNSLTAVKSTLIQTYKTRTGKSEAELSGIMTAETWYTATEAVENNFADEVAGEVFSQFDASKKILFVNKLSVDCRKFDCAKLKSKLDSTPIERAGKMENVLEKIKELLSKKEPEVEEKIDVTAMREQEIARIKSLAGLRDGTSAIDAIVDLAIRDGKTCEEIKPYTDAVKNSLANGNETAQAILNLIEDNLKSGAEGVGGSSEETAEDKLKAQAALIAKYANQ